MIISYKDITPSMNQFHQNIKDYLPTQDYGTCIQSWKRDHNSHETGELSLKIVMICAYIYQNKTISNIY